MASIGRLLILFAVFVIALAALMTEPLDDSPKWAEIFYASKAIALVGFVVFGKFYTRWSKTDKWFKAYNDRCEGENVGLGPDIMEREEERK